MFGLSVIFIGCLFALFIIVCLVRWWMSVRSLTEEARLEYATRKVEKPQTVKTVSKVEFVRLYVSAFQPRWTLYASAATACALLVSPLALIAVPAIYDIIWRANGAPEWGGRTGYVYMFSLFFGIVFIWASLAAVFARLQHMRAPEPFHHALARARGEPIEDTGWRPRPKWARKVRPNRAADTQDI